VKPVRRVCADGPMALGCAVQISRKSENMSSARDVSGEGVQQVVRTQMPLLDLLDRQ
jgi:hypothetical protein